MASYAGGGGSSNPVKSTAGTPAKGYNRTVINAIKARTKAPSRSATRKPIVAAPTKKAYTPAAVSRRVSAPAPSRSSSGGGRSYSSSSSSSAPKPAPKPKPVPKPKPPSIEEFLRGDTTYLQQQAGSKLAGSQFNTQYNDQLGQYGEEYNLNKVNLGKALSEANTGMTDDYSSRGMMNSSAYGTAYQDQQTEFDNRQLAMDNARTQFLTDQGAKKTNFGAEQNLSNQKARSDAINRRAAGLAI